MTADDQTAGTDLAEVERRIRAVLDRIPDSDAVTVDKAHVRELLAEYDRRGTELVDAQRARVSWSKSLRRMSIRRDALSRMLREMARRSLALRGENRRLRADLESQQNLAATFQRYLDKASDEIERLQDWYRDSIANRDSSINRLLGQQAALRQLAEERRQVVPTPHGDVEVGGLHVGEVLAALGETRQAVGIERTVTAALDQQRGEIVAWLRSEVEGWLPGGGEHRQGWIDALTQAADDLASAGPQQERARVPLPRRDDHVARWLKQRRDGYIPRESGWVALDYTLDDYRLHADTGTPLDQHACEGAYCCGEFGEELGPGEVTRHG